MNFAVRTLLEFTPRKASECAGLVLLQNHNFHFRFVCRKNTDGKLVLRVYERAHGRDVVRASAELPNYSGRLYLKIEGAGMLYFFYYATEPEAWQPLGGVDGRNLSTTVAEGFTGVYIGMYASSNGKASTNHADFDYFEYQRM
jgi:xylan 1,4-beta-xylosidase